MTGGLIHPSRMTLDELHFRLSEALAKRRLGDWQRGFAISFVGLCKRGGHPSAKQEIFARRIVADLRAPGAAFGGEASLIDDDDGGHDE